MNARSADPEFYQYPGVLSADVRSYVPRQADQELLQEVLAGHYCYILTPRQMGKTSLVVRTQRKLADYGARSVRIDLSSIGSAGISQEQWYFGQLVKIAEQLQLGEEYEAWWEQRQRIGFVQRFTDFLTKYVLRRIAEPLVVFIDEIDYTLKMGNYSDEYFAAIRSLHNAREDDSVLKRLTFVLVGVASPSDLMKDATRTPFNVGTRIELTDFTAREAQLLAEGLCEDPRLANDLLDEVIFWTGGHPYLSQRACKEVARLIQSHKSPHELNPQLVDEVVHELFLDDAARHTDSNLKTVRDQILRVPQRDELLALYRDVREHGETEQDDALNPICTQLKLTGIVKRTASGTLKVRNSIYSSVFNARWITSEQLHTIGLEVMPPEMTSDVFICHSTVDDEWVRTYLRPRLEAAGLRVAANEDLRLGADWAREIERQITESRYVVIVLSPEWAKDQWMTVGPFVVNKTHGMVRSSSHPIIPLLRNPDAPIPPRLRGYTIADFTDEERWEREIARIVETVGVPVQERAPKVYISYSHDTPRHKERVLWFAQRLRADGIDVAFDQFAVAHDEPMTRWVARNVAAADFVLAVCTSAYSTIVSREEVPGARRETKSELDVVRDVLGSHALLREKFVPILLDTATTRAIPKILSRLAYYRPEQPGDYHSLLQHLSHNAKRPLLGRRGQGGPRPLPQSPMVWTVPHARNPFFTGRQSMMNAIQGQLERHGRVSIYGFSGVGKTQIAAEFAHRRRDAYRAVLWVDATNEATIVSSMIDLFDVLGIPGSEQIGAREALETIRQWLRRNDGWLLICDSIGATKTGGFFRDLRGQGHLLVVGHRFENVRRVVPDATPMRVTPLPRVEGSRFLVRRTGRGTPALTIANELATVLLGLPLAMELAGAFILESGLDFAGYIEMYSKHTVRFETANRADLDPTMRAVVVTPLDIAMGAIRTRFAAAIDVLLFSAFMHPERIPLELIARGAAHLGQAIASEIPDSQDDYDLYELFDPLTRFSLIRRDPRDSSYSIHPAMQVAIEGLLTTKEHRVWAERAVSVLAHAYPSAEESNLPFFDRLFPHARRSVQHIKRYNFASVDAALLLDRLAYHLVQRKQFDEAETAFRLSLKIRSKIDSGTDQYAGTLSSFAQLLQRRGRLDEAVELQQQSLEMLQRRHGPNHHEVGFALSMLGTAYAAQERFDLAEEAYGRALTIFTSTYGEDGVPTASVLTMLGSLYQAGQQFEKAESVFRDALARQERACGAQHPEVARTLMSLAGVRSAVHDAKGAVELAMRALHIFEKGLGPEHPEVAVVLRRLERLQRAAGNQPLAKSYAVRAVAIEEKIPSVAPLP